MGVFFMWSDMILHLLVTLLLALGLRPSELP